MNVNGLAVDLQKELRRRKYFLRLKILDQTPSLLKTRLYISSELFVQAYRNDRYDTTNFVLVHGGQRLYDRDQIGGRWHRHTYSAPEEHNFSRAGAKPVNLQEFLDEVEELLAELDLP